MPAITISNLSKSFNQTEVLKGFSLDIESQKITAIFGPNGCGKSTILNILAGTIDGNGGQAQIREFDPYKFSYIFQNYRESLLPWRTNFKNLTLPLEIQGKSKSEIKQKVNELQELFGFKFNWNGYPYELSGGQQQILAFMRALITNPRILFIDEPFSALDYENNLQLREHLQKYYLKYKPTILLVTHNIEEAVHLASGIVILSKKPTRVLRTINNDEPYPRDLQLLKTDRFHQIKNEVLSVFEMTASL